jgi:transposase-like protein
MISGERGWLWRAVDDAAAKAVVLPTVAHLRGWRQNNRVENSHQPVRQRERRLLRFKSLRHAARFCSVFSTVCNQFRPGRHALSAANYRTVMRRRWWEWDLVSEMTTSAIAREVSAQSCPPWSHAYSTPTVG